MPEALTPWLNARGFNALVLMECSTCLYLGGRRGFGGTAPNKLKSSGEGRDTNEVSEPCRRHGLKLVVYK
jgi:hypothetical protein